MRLSRKTIHPTVALVYRLVLVSLANIQEELGNPYNPVGADDIDLDFSKDYRAVFESPR